MSRAEYNIGIFYVMGYAVEKNEGEAHRWFARAAEHGFPLPKVLDDRPSTDLIMSRREESPRPGCPRTMATTTTHTNCEKE
jgi:hypothetical protein